MSAPQHYFDLINYGLEQVRKHGLDWPYRLSDSTTLSLIAVLCDALVSPCFSYAFQQCSNYLFAESSCSPLSRGPHVSFSPSLHRYDSYSRPHSQTFLGYLGGSHCTSGKRDVDRLLPDWGNWRGRVGRKQSFGFRNGAFK